MTINKRKTRINKIFLLMLIGSIAFTAYFTLFVDTTNLTNIISQTNITYFGFAFIVYIIGIFFSSLVWHSLLNNLAVKITIKNALLFTWAGLFFDVTIPQLGVSGDAAKTYLFSKASSENFGKIGASVIGQKIMVLTITVVTFSIGLGMTLLNYAMPLSTMISVIAFLTLSIFSLVFVYYVSFHPKATDALLRFAIKVALFFRSKWNPENFTNKVQETLKTFHYNVDQLKAKPKSLLKPALYSIFSWTLDIAVMILAFIAVGYSVPIDKVLIVYTITGALQAGGVAILGVNEIIMIESFGLLGIPREVSIIVTLLTRAVTFWFRLIISYTAFQWTGIKLVKKKR